MYPFQSALIHDRIWKPRLIYVVPCAATSLHPKPHLDRFIRFCRAHRRVQNTHTDPETDRRKSQTAATMTRSAKNWNDKFENEIKLNPWLHGLMIDLYPILYISIFKLPREHIYRGSIKLKVEIRNSSVKLAYWQCEQWNSIVLHRRHAVFDVISALLLARLQLTTHACTTMPAIGQKAETVDGSVGYR